MSTPTLTIHNTLTGHTEQKECHLLGNALHLPLNGSLQLSFTLTEHKGPNAKFEARLVPFPHDPRKETPILSLPKNWARTCHFTAILRRTTDDTLKFAYVLVAEHEASPLETLKKLGATNQPGIARQLVLITDADLKARLDSSNVALAA